MIIVYESKAGFTKRYAEILAEKTGFKAFSTSELGNADLNDEIIFMGWINTISI